MGRPCFALICIALGIAVGVTFVGCGGGAEAPQDIRPDGGTKGIEELAADQVNCDFHPPDVESFYVAEASDKLNPVSIPDGGATRNSAVQVRITLRDTLPKGCIVRVLRNDEPLPRGLTECDRSCTFVDTLPLDGTYEYRVRAEAGGTPNVVGTSPGILSDTYTIALDRVPPVETVSEIAGPNGPAQTRDTKPQISGRINAQPGAGKFVKLQRDGGKDSPAFVTLAVLPVKADRTWSYQETSALALDESKSATYTYRALVVDAAGNEGAASKFELKIDRSTSYIAPAVSVASAFALDRPADKQALAVKDGLAAVSNTRSLRLSGTLSEALGTGQILAVFRNGVRVADAKPLTSDPKMWNWPAPDGDAVDLPEGDHVFRVRVEDGKDPAEFGESAEVVVPIDKTPPEAAFIYGLSNNRPFQFQPKFPSVYNLTGRTLQEVKFSSTAKVTDPDPRIVVEYNLVKDESLTIQRTGAADSIVSSPGASSLSFRMAPAVPRPPALPNDKAQDVAVRTIQTDAAGNTTDVTFRFTIEIAACNFAHAQASAAPASAHEALRWERATRTPTICKECHQIASGGYVGITPLRGKTAELNYLGEPNWYWCKQ